MRGDTIKKNVDNEEMASLAEAFQNCNIDLLVQLVQKGVDLNLIDEYGNPLWEKIRENYHCYIDDPVEAAILQGEETTREKDVCDFLDYAIDNGLRLSEVYYENGTIPYSPLAWLIYFSFSPTLLTYLVKKGIDMNIVLDGYYLYPMTIIDVLEQEAMSDRNEDHEAGQLWSEKAITYLRAHGAKAFDELYPDYEHVEDS